MRCLIYSRVSTDAQERDGTSLDTQERACDDYAANRGWTVVERIRDAASGFSLERPGLHHGRALLREGRVDVVLAYALDRLSRKQTHVAILVEEIDECGAQLEFVTEKFEDTATGQLLRSVKAFAAEFEREKIAERTTRGKGERARTGRLPQGNGKGIYGYIYNHETGKREMNLAQAQIVQRIFARFCAGGSCHGIAVDLNREGIPTLTGSTWHPLTVRRLLENETYTGTTIYRRTRVEHIRDARTGRKRRQIRLRDEADWIEVRHATPALISRALFQRAQSLLQDPERRLRGQPSQLYRLRGHIRCLTCSTPMVGQALMHGKYSYYRCRRSYGQRTEVKCHSRYVSADLLERVVREQLANVLCNPAIVLEEAEHLAASDPAAERQAALAVRLEEVEAQQRRLARLYLSGSMPESVLDEEGKLLNAERNRLERERQELETGRAPSIDLAELRRALPRVLELLRQYIMRAESDDLSLLLSALQVEVAASHERVLINGVVPMRLPDGLDAMGDADQNLVTIARTSGCLSPQRISNEGVPYDLPRLKTRYRPDRRRPVAPTAAAP